MLESSKVSRTSPSQGAQQECSRISLTPPGAFRKGLSAVFTIPYILQMQGIRQFRN